MSNNEKSKVGAGLTGASAGTLLLIYANNLPDDNPFKPLLVLIAPSTSIVISWLKPKVDDYLDERALFIRRRRINEIFEETLNNPKLSEEHKASIRQAMEEINIIIANREVEKTRISIRK